MADDEPEELDEDIEDSEDIEGIKEEENDDVADSEDDPEEPDGLGGIAPQGHRSSGGRKAKGRSSGRSKAGGKKENTLGFNQKGKLEFNIGGLSSAKIGIIFAAGSTVLGAMWGGFQVYQQFLTMQRVTAAYVPPDLSGINQRISVLEERATSVERLTKGNSEALNYLTNSISSSVSGTRQTVDAVASSVRNSEAQNMSMQRAMIEQLRQQDQEQQRRIKDLEASTDQKITKVLANPLAGKD